MADIQQLIVDLRLRGDFNEKMGRARKNLTGFNQEAGRTTGRLDKLRGKLRSPELKAGLLQGVGLSGGLIGFQLLTTGISKAVDIGGDAIRMAAEEEAAIAQLTKAIDRNVDAWDGNIDAVERQINTNQRLAFSDGEQREALRLLVGQTNDVDEAFRLLGTSMDFARFRGIDLKTSADLLGRAYAGNFQTLSRYGVVLKEGATAQDALRQIQELSEGQARAYADTTQGKLTRAQIALDDAMEDLGRTITPIVADLAEMAADTLPDLVIGAQDTLAPLARLADEFDNIGNLADGLGDIVGRDLVNDFANFARIVGTGGLALYMDATGTAMEGLIDTGERLPGIFGDIQGGLQDVQRATIGVNQDTELLSDRYGVLTDTWMGYIATADGVAGATEGVGDASADADDSIQVLSSSIGAMVGEMGAAASATAGAATRLQDFKDNAAEIADTRSLPRINQELKEQRKALREAAEAGDVRKFSAAAAAIEQLRGEKALRKQGRQTLNAYLGNTDKQSAAQAKVTRKVLGTKNALTKLDQIDPTIDIQVNTQAAINAIANVRSNLFGLFGLGGSTAGRPPDPPQSFHTGGTIRAGQTAIVRQGEALIRPASDTEVRPMDDKGKGTTVYVTPTLNIAATQVERGTSKVVRTQRFRANT